MQNQLLWHPDVPQFLKQHYWNGKYSEKEFIKESIKGLNFLCGRISHWAICDYCGKPTKNYIRINEKVVCSFCQKSPK